MFLDLPCTCCKTKQFIIITAFKDVPGGQSILRYDHYVKLNRYAIVPTACFIMLGSLLLIVAMWSLRSYIDPMMGQDTYNLMRTIMSLMIILFAIEAMRCRCISEGMLLLMAGLSSLIFSISESNFETSGFGITYLFFSAGFLSSGYVFYKRKQFFITLGTIVFSIATLLPIFMPDHYIIITGTGFMIAGLIFVLNGCYDTVKIGWGKEPKRYIGYKDLCSEDEYAHMLVSTAGILSFATLSLVLGYHVLDTGEHNVSLYIVKLLLSAVVISFGVYALSRGIIGEGLMMFVLAISTFSAAILSLMHLEYPASLNMILSVVYIALTMEFFMKRDVLLFMTCLLIFLVFFLESFTEQAESLEVAITILKIVSAYSAIAALLFFETGKDVLPRNLHLSKKEVA